MRVESATWRRSVIALRISAPALLVASIVVGGFAWMHESYGLAVVDGFCAACNAVLTWVEWRVFEL